MPVTVDFFQRARGWRKLFGWLHDEKTPTRAWETACLTDIGGREEQQDRAAVFEGERGRLLVLADGAGGHEGGALAAQTVIDVASEQFRAFDAAREGTPTSVLERIALDAHERINAAGRELGIRPHTTCVLLYVDSSHATWAHVGDNRLYRFAEGRVAERTIDHSIVELIRLQGRITEEEMKTHPDKNRLYEALGGEQTPQVETGGAPNTARQAFLLVSDGVWENVSNADMEAVFLAEDLDEAVRHLIEHAKAHGGPECDNLAAIACRPKAESH